MIGAKETMAPLKDHLGDEYEILRVPSMDHSLDIFSRCEIHLMIWETDEDSSENHKGLEVLEVVQKDSPSTQIIMIVPRSDLELAFKGLDMGAYQFLKKPLDSLELAQTAQLALEKAPIGGPSQLLDHAGENRLAFEGILGKSQGIRDLVQLIQQVAQSDATVLITGETGTGKDLVAAAIHRQSLRRERAFIPLNTGAIPEDLIDAELMGYAKGAFTGAGVDKEGCFEQADGGTLFLDELGTMPHRAQVSLLRVMEKKPFRRVGGKKYISSDVRIIGATNENLLQAVKQKKFREDLFYRFDMFSIHLPPLRDRAGDISFLAQHFMGQFSKKYNKSICEIDGEVLHYLEHYPWPGNVRELKNVIQRASLICQGEVLLPEHLNSRITMKQELPKFQFSPGMKLEDIEKIVIEKTVLEYSKSEAAKVLGISRKTLYNKMIKYQLEP